MKATIQKWGNSLAVRIPISMAKDLKLESGSEVELIEETDKIIIQLKRGPRLEDFLQAINESNIHEEIEFNSPYESGAW